MVADSPTDSGSRDCSVVGLYVQVCSSGTAAFKALHGLLKFSGSSFNSSFVFNEVLALILELSEDGIGVIEDADTLKYTVELPKCVALM